MTDLSILIPARNEMFLARTIEDILENKRADTEIIAVLDGAWSDPGIPQHKDVNIVYLPESIGQRAATNLAAKLARGEWLMKIDAHCSFAEGFDKVLLEDITPDVTMVPIMRNLHAFDWVCKFCGVHTYQGPEPDKCKECKSKIHSRNIVWIAKKSPQNMTYRFTPEMEFKYFPELRKRQHGDLVETMSLQGSCWMVHRDKFFDLTLCDESWGSWGGMGAEVAVKTWLSGGRVICNRRTYYAHLFRTQKGFSHPYPNPGNEQKKAKDTLRRVFLNNAWEHQTRSLEWLVDKFAPVPGWEKEKSKAIVYYTCNTHKPEIDEACQLPLIMAGLPVVSVSLNKPIDFGDEQIQMSGDPGPLMMHKQILEGLKACQADIVFLCESDVLYHLSHFDYNPLRDDVFYYNTNVWKLHLDGLATWTDGAQQVSGLCASRRLLIDYFTKRITEIKAVGFDRHYEPRGKRFYDHQKGGKYGEQSWQSAKPNVCIRHNDTLTKAKRSPEEYRNPKYAKGWKTSKEIPGWGDTKELLEVIL